MKIQARQLNHDLLSGKPVALIDVRTPVEHEEAHIEGSRLMPLDRLDPEQVKSAARDAGWCVLICRSGKRAEQAFEKLRAAGCENLSILDGGVGEWELADLPLVRTERRRLPLMRQVQLVIGLVALIGSILALTLHVNFAIVPAILGAGLTLAGATGWCGLAILLSKMPWNRTSCGCVRVTSCSV